MGTSTGVDVGAGIEVEGAAVARTRVLSGFVDDDEGVESEFALLRGFRDREGTFDWIDLI